MERIGIRIQAMFDSVLHNRLKGQRRQAEAGMRRVVFDEETFSVLSLFHSEIGTGVIQF